MMAKIQDKNRWYFFLRPYVDFMFKMAYRRVEYVGKEKIPQDAAIIYAPNHTGALLDALAVLAIDRKAKVFVARADVFKNPVALKILTFLKMLPINRKRDGVENLSKNDEINDTVVDVLRDKVPFCIMPEAAHRAMHSLMPLQKGVFRIALQAAESFGNETPVYIVPVGIEYGHFFRYRSSMLVQIGEPIDITQFVAEHADLTASQQINELRDELAQGLKTVMLQIADNENYQATLELAQLRNKAQQRKLKLRGNSLINRFTAAKASIAETEAALQADPQRTQKLLDAAGEFSRQRHVQGIGMESVLTRHIGWALAWKMLLLAAGLPLFVLAAVATLPIILLSMWLCSKFKDKAFHNTVRYLITLVLLPLVLLPAFLFVHAYLRLVRRFVSDFKFLINRNLQQELKKLI